MSKTNIISKGFTVKSLKTKLILLPTEDSFRIDSKQRIISVADGVHLDCKNNQIVNASLRGIRNSLFYYPRPSPAKVTADIFTSRFYEILKEFTTQDEKAIRESFELINEEIKEYNLSIGISYENMNYTVNYPAGCTAVGTVETNSEEIYFGSLTDCGLAILDSQGDLRFKTDYDGPGSRGDYSRDLKIRGLS